MVYLLCIHYDLVKSINYEAPLATFTSLLLLLTFLGMTGFLFDYTFLASSARDMAWSMASAKILGMVTHVLVHYWGICIW
jgi:hypothetical protein